MSATRTMGINVTDVGTSKVLPLGFVYRQPASGDDYGEKHWVYIYNDGSADMTAGAIIIRDPSAASTSAPVGLLYGCDIAGASTPVPAMAIVGVAQHTIAAGSYGFVQSKGKCLVQCGTANISADTAITSGGSGAGDAIDFADGAEECVFGFSLEAEASDNTTFDAYINCLGA